MWRKLKLKIAEAIEIFVPKKTRRKGKQKTQWWNGKIRRLRKNRLRAWTKYRESKLYQDYLAYKRARNRASKEVRKAQRRFERKLAKNIKSNPKAFYKYARNKMSVKEKVGPLEDENGMVVMDDTRTAEILNQYFTSVFTQEVMENLPVPTQVFRGTEEEELVVVDVGQGVVMKKLKELKPDKAPGVDNIYPVVLQQLAGILCIPLSVLFKKSLETKQVPEDWKNANVTPLFKKGLRGLAENYRPVSLTCVCSKLLESIVRDAIVEHLKRHNLIGDSQHGFLKGRSCLTNLLFFLEKVTAFVDEGYPVDVLYLDFSKAFDKVPHKRLLLKLRAHGIGMEIRDWIGEWLDGRNQRVVVNGKMSEWSRVTSGVPQGSVLGPTLFLIYINDIYEGLVSTVLKFADDTKVFRRVASVEDACLLQEDLTRMYDWSLEWQMLFNTSKCRVMHVGRGNECYDYFMGGTMIEATEEEKDLGVWINNKLTPSSQVAKAVMKANRVLGMIKRTYVNRSKNNILNLYKSLVRPHLEYCVQAWRPFLQQDVDNIEKVQRRATKMIPELANLEYSERLKRCKLTTLEIRRYRADLLEVFRIVHGIDELEPNSFFTLRRAREGRNLRCHNFHIEKQRFNLLLRKFCFSQRVIDQWNALPVEAVNAPTVNAFKNHLDRILKQRRGLTISQRRLFAPITRATDNQYVYYM